jgi:hypothetical protein
MEDGGNNMVGYLSYNYFTDLFALSLYDGLAFLFTDIGAHTNSRANYGIFYAASYTKAIKELVDEISTG